jgi:hypothetical protein
MSVVDSYGFSVAHYLTNGHVWRAYFVPGFDLLFGPAWPATLALAAGGVLLGLRRNIGPVLRIAALAAAAGFGAYVVTPTSAFGPPGRPTLFGENLRYLWPSVTLGLTLLTRSRPARRWPVPIAIGLLALTAVTLTSQLPWRFADRRTAVVCVAVMLPLTGFVAMSAKFRAPKLRASLGVIVIAIILAGYPLQQLYLDRRYRSTSTATQALFARVTEMPFARIAVAGTRLQYPFWGVALNNRVRYLGQVGPHHAFEDFGSCEAFRLAVRKQRAGILVVAAAAPAMTWAASDPAAHLVLGNAAGSIYSIDPGFGTTACGPSA